MGHYVDASKTIYIDLEEIYTKSHGIPASNYDLLVEVIMHERLNAEHEHNKPNVIVEKRTWDETARRYRAIFDKEPPLVSGSGSNGGANPDYRKHNHGIPSCE